MKIKQALYLGVAVAALGAFVAVAPKDVRAETAAVTIDGDDIGGVVTGPSGPEDRRVGYCGDERPSRPSLPRLW